MRWLFIVIAGLAVEFGVAVLLGKCMAIGSGTHPRAPPPGEHGQVGSE